MMSDPHTLETKMSIAHLQSFFATRTGRQVLPEQWPMDVLISLTRELAFLDEGRLDHAEIHQLKTCLCDLMERILSMQPISRLRRFREDREKLLPELVTELNKNIRDELVVRLIGHRSGTVELEDAFEEHFSEAF